jgi:ATP-dependent helicase Lhr and Lhr-like helicase
VFCPRVSPHRSALVENKDVIPEQGKGHNAKNTISIPVIVSSVFPLLHESLRQVLTQRCDWQDLREVQEQAYHTIHAGNDTLIIAPTAGGKSEAALIPVMDAILRQGLEGISCVYLSPLKALINDQEERFRSFCIPTSLSVMKWHGDVEREERSWGTEDPPHFLMITPESLEVLLREKNLADDLTRVRFVIVDELHAFVESERGTHLKVLLERLDRSAGRKVQRIGLSATAGNPDEILHWFTDYRHKSEVIAAPSEPREKQFVFIIEPEERRRTDALARIVLGKKALVFVNSRSSAERLMQSCAGRVRNLHVHHSSLAQSTRKLAEEAFLSEEGACIICTSTLELGIDIGDLDLVVQVGPPDSVSSFLQRMGRSGRRGKAASVAWILSSPCEFLCSTAIIECAVERNVEALIPRKKPYNVLLQQIFLSFHSMGRTTQRELVSEILSIPVFHEVPPAILTRILDHLNLNGYLTKDGEMIMPGPETERTFFRSNGKDLYSVIRGGGEYRVVTPDGEVIGNLDARFVNNLGSDGISLGGRTWSVVKCDDGHNLVVVVPGGSPSSHIFWTGAESAGFSPLVCRQMQRICANGESSLPVRDHERDAIARALARFPDGIGTEGLYISENPENKGVVFVASFQGSGFNRILASLLRHLIGGRVEVRYNDFFINVSRSEKDAAGERVAAAIRSIPMMTREEAGALLPLPPYENWKFARILPEDLFRDMIISDHYQVEEFLARMRDVSISFLMPSQPDQSRG